MEVSSIKIILFYFFILCTYSCLEYHQTLKITFVCILPLRFSQGFVTLPPTPHVHSFVVNLSATPLSECQFTYQKGSSHSFLSLPFKKNKDITEYSLLYLNTFSSNNTNKKPCTIVKMILFSVYVTSRSMSLDHTVTKSILILTSIH